MRKVGGIIRQLLDVRASYLRFRNYQLRLMVGSRISIKNMFIKLMCLFECNIDTDSHCGVHSVSRLPFYGVTSLSNPLAMR